MPASHRLPEPLASAPSPDERRAAAGHAWVVLGVVSLGFAVALYQNLGSSLAVSTSIVAGWLLVIMGFAGWRWWTDPLRSRLYLASALVGVAAAAMVGSGVLAGLPELKSVLALYWVTSGILELVGRSAGNSVRLQSPWSAVTMLFAGVVIVTFPSVLGVEFTMVSSLWALVFGVLCTIRGTGLLWRGHRPPRGRRGRVRRVVATALPALLVAAPAVLYGAFVEAHRTAEARQLVLAPFYEPPHLTSPGIPGDMVRSEPIDLSGLNGRAWRIMFRSQDQYGAPTVSTGLVFAPDDAGSNRPVVAWAHGTTGLGPTCAPSRSADPLDYMLQGQRHARPRVGGGGR